MQVDGRAQTHSLQGLTPGARYEVTVVSVRGFEESEPLEGFLSTSEWATPGAGRGGRPGVQGG